MNAIQSSKSLRPQPPHPRAAKPQRQNSHIGETIEASTKLGVNLLLAAIAVSALAQLLPYQLTQREKLQEMQAEVNLTSQRINQLEVQYKRSSQPQEVKRIVQEQSNLIDASNHKVVWIQPKPATHPAR